MYTVRDFDSFSAKLITRLPKRLEQPFHWLGLCFVPTTWAALLVLYIALTNNVHLLRASSFVLLLVPLATVSKLLFRRHRPPTIYAGKMRIKSYSFPSSHAYAAALAGGFFIYTALAHHLPLVALLLTVLVLVIGISRVYLGAHYPSDVVGGWIIAIIVLWVILMLL